MKIDPNKQPPPKPIPSATEQVMQGVKWVIVIWVAKSMFTPIFAAINDRGGKFGEWAEQSKRGSEQLTEAIKKSEVTAPTAIKATPGVPTARPIDCADPKYSSSTDVDIINYCSEQSPTIELQRMPLVSTPQQ